MDYDDTGTENAPVAWVPSLLLFLSGSLIITFSVLHLVRVLAGPLPILSSLNVQPDIIEGAIMLLEGALFIYGSYELFNGRVEGIAFAWVGWMTGLLLSSVSALVLLSNAFSAEVLSVEGMEDWSAAGEVVPALYLGVIMIILLPFLAGYGRRPDRSTDGRPLE